MVDKLLNNCFFLGAFSGLIAVLVLYLHNKNANNIEKDDKIYIKMFILVAVLACSAVFASQYNLTSSKISSNMAGGAINIHTGAPGF